MCIEPPLSFLQNCKNRTRKLLATLWNFLRLHIFLLCFICLSTQRRNREKTEASRSKRKILHSLRFVRWFRRYFPPLTKTAFSDTKPQTKDKENRQTLPSHTEKMTFLYGKGAVEILTLYRLFDLSFCHEEKKACQLWNRGHGRTVNHPLAKGICGLFGVLVGACHLWNAARRTRRNTGWGKKKPWVTTSFYFCLQVSIKTDSALFTFTIKTDIIVIRRSLYFALHGKCSVDYIL